MNMENSKKSFVYVLKHGSQSHVTPEITKPALVLDETCIKEFDFGTSLMGRAKDVSAIPKLPCIISKEGFQNVKLSYFRGMWVLFEFDSLASKEKFLNHSEDDQDDLSSDGESQEGNVTKKVDNNESDVDRVSKSSYMHKNDTAHKDVNICKKGEVGSHSEDPFNIMKSLNIVEPNGLIRLKKKLQALKIAIKAWSKEANKRSNDRKINIQQNLSEFNKLIDQGKSNDEILIKRITLLNDLQELNNWNAMEISQKAKIRWSIEGDENSKYFHGIGVSSNVVAAATSLIGCSILTASFSYLGVKIKAVKIACKHVRQNRVVSCSASAPSSSSIPSSTNSRKSKRDNAPRARTDAAWEHAIDLGQRKKVQSTLNKIYKKDKRDKVCQQIDWFFYISALSFNCVKNPKFKKMIQMVCDFGRGLDPPSYHEMRVTYLKKEVDYTKALLEGYKKEWKKTGCTLMSDGWSDRKNRSICNFLVNSPKGIIFLASIDTSEISKTKENVFTMLDDFVEKIGEEHVVQVVTDNAANYKAAGEMEFTKGKELLRPGTTRFATSYLTLGRLHEQKGFWGSVSTCLLAAIPLIKVLRMVDSDFTPAMGFIYQAMKKAKEEIKSNYKSVQSRYEPIINISDARWDNQLNRPLHVAGYFLNPRMQYSPDFKDVESDDEWITEEESTQSQAHDSGGDNVFLESAIRSQFALDTHKLIPRRSPWQDVILAIHLLQSKGEVALKVLYKRMPRGGMEQKNYDLLCSKVTDLVLPNISDRWCCSLEGSQEFSVKSSRILIDNTNLSKAEVPTRWLRVVPIKVNINAWRVFLDKLSTRSNLSLRGMDIPSIACPLFYKFRATVFTGFLRAIDEIPECCGVTETPKYIKFFIFQEITKCRRLIRVLRDEVDIAKSALGQVNAMIAEMESMDDPFEYADSLGCLKDSKRILG
uniref:DUF659 domain-containing protein n=1 Tax=Tanacetum cinerariifolium TaxID=118510 RepID=A0A6L2ML93_TANCI|nr:hypothetical protein [Tanacetum cinerariifolium]